MSARKDLLLAVKSLAETARNQKYFVRRGMINWATFAFSKYPLAISIHMDTCTLFPVSPGFNEGMLTLEFAASIPEAGIKNAAEIDDEALDCLFNDAISIIEKLKAQKNSEQDPIVMNIRTTRCVEYADVSLKVQGIVVTLDVTY